MDADTTFTIKPIGWVESSYEGGPSEDVEATIELFQAYAEGAVDIKAGDRLIAVLTKEELDAGYFLLLASSPLAESDVPTADKAALDSLAKSIGATPGTWFDISLYKVLSTGEEQERISETGYPVQLAVTVPEYLRKDGRTFFVLRSHDGQAVVAAEGTGTTLTWETEEFSPYTIAYRDSDSSWSDNTKPVAGSTSVGTTPKTGDSPLAIAIGILFAGAALALVAGGVALRRRGE